VELFIYTCIGLIVGGVTAWLLARAHFQGYYAKQITDLKTSCSDRITDLEKKSSGAEARIEELRQQIQLKDLEISQTRNELDAEKEVKARLEESQKYLQEERQRLETLRRELSETFKSLSLEALSKNTDEFMKRADDFMKLAEEKLKLQTTEGKKELEGKKGLIDQSIQLIDKTLSEIKTKIDDVGKGSIEVSTLIKKHEEVTSKLKDTTEHLSHALASSKKRGEWGERMAEDVIRLIGMVEGINYIKQKTLESSQGRPDYTFLLPNKLKINMDVKFPLDNYMHYLNATSDHDRNRYKEELLRNTKVMIKQLTTRDYINPADNTVDYVIMFIPNEQVYSFINEADTTIMDEALKQKVILCSPFSLYAVLAVIRQAIENFNLERTASEILRLLGEFSKQWTVYKDKFRIMGERLDAAKREYETLITTRSNMLEKPLKKIEDLRNQRATGSEEKIKLDEVTML